MRSHEDRLLDGQTGRRTDGRLPTPTGNIVRPREVPISIDNEKSAGDFLREWITHVYAHHEVRREIGAPRSRVVEIVLGVQPIVPNKAAEDSPLDCQPLTYGRKIRNIRRAQLT